MLCMYLLILNYYYKDCGITRKTLNNCTNYTSSFKYKNEEKNIEFQKIPKQFLITFNKTSIILKRFDK